MIRLSLVEVNQAIISLAGLGPSIKPILRDTFIELFEEVVNKLKDKIVDHDDTFDDIPESDEDIIEY